MTGLEDDPYVKEKIFQLECEELFALIDQDEPIPTPEPMEHGDINPSPSATNHKTVIQSNGKSSSSLTPGPSRPKYFKPCEKHKNCYKRVPLSQPGTSGINGMQLTKPPSPQPGLSGMNQVGRGWEEKEKPYTYELKRQRVFAKNKAIDNTFQVKFNDHWQGEKMSDLSKDLHQMFDDISDNVRGNPNDFGRVVVHGVHKNPIVVPLQTWDKLDSETVLDGITNVLNSNEELVVDDSLEISVGSIEVPSGSGGSHLPITTLFGPNNSLKRNQSIFEVTSDTLSANGHCCVFPQIM